MARKSKKKRRVRPHARGVSSDPAVLLEQGWASLEGADVRAALDQFRALRKVDEAAARLPLMCACRARVRQLRARGLALEARAMERNAHEYRHHLDPSVLDEEGWLRFLRFAAPEDAVSTYAAVAAGNHPDQHAWHLAEPAARVVADQLVVGRCWQQLDRLPADHPLRRDAVLVGDALAPMDAADWAQAGALLAAVPRHSPYAGWRLFCKAMTCFDTADAAGLARALAALPTTFVLRDAVAALRQVTAREVDVEARAPTERVIELLGIPPSQGHGTPLFKALAAQDTRRIETVVRALSERILPADPAAAVAALFEIVAAWYRPRIMAPNANRAFHKLLPHPRGLALGTRVDLLGQAFVNGEFPGEEAVAYLQNIAAEFPEPERQRLARGRVLLFLARWTRDENMPTSFLSGSERELVSQLVADRRYDGELLFAGLAQAGLALDPQDRAGHDLWLELLRRHDAGCELQQDMLRVMAARFPQDPGPWLELGRLHLQRHNAYRKAQQALLEARARAPQDPRVRDLEVVTRLRAAVQGRRRRSFARARADLLAAVEMRQPELAEVQRAEQMALELCDPDGTGAAGVRRMLKSLTGVARLRSAAILLRNLYSTTGGRAPAAVQVAVALLREQESLVVELTPGEVPLVCAPLPKDALLLFGERCVVSVLEPWWALLLGKIERDRCLALADALLAVGGLEQVKTEIETRLAGVTDGTGDPVWCFYRLVLRAVTNELCVDDALAAIRTGLDDDGERALHAAAQRLAVCADPEDPLSAALAEGDLEYLEILLEPLATPYGDVIPAQEDLFPELPGKKPRRRRRPARDPDFAAPGDVPEGEGDSGDFMAKIIQDVADEMGVPGPQLVRALAGAAGLDPGKALGPFGDDETFWEPNINDSLAEAESLVDAARLRGEPLSVLRDVAGQMWRDPEMVDRVELLADLCRDVREQLSTEAQVLLYPRNKGRRQRSKGQTKNRGKNKKSGKGRRRR